MRLYEISYRRGLTLLLARQTPAGCWTAGTAPEPGVALTGAAIIALSHRRSPPAHAAARERAVRWLLARQHVDGSFGEGRNRDRQRPEATAMAVRALSAASAARYAEPIARAVRWLVSVQATYGAERGGISRGEAATAAATRRPCADPCTTAAVAEAIRLSGVPVPRRFWIDLIAYVRGVQNREAINRLNRPAHDRLRARGLRFADDGGLFTPPTAAGQLISETDATLHGITALYAAGLNDAAPELHGALDWLRGRYPALAATREPTARRCRLLAAALASTDRARFTADDGRSHDWIEEIARQLVQRQDADRGWSDAETIETLLAWTHVFDALRGRAAARGTQPSTSDTPRTRPSRALPSRRPATARVVAPQRRSADRVRSGNGAATSPPRTRPVVMTGWGVMR